MAAELSVTRARARLTNYTSKFGFLVRIGSRHWHVVVKYRGAASHMLGTSPCLRTTQRDSEGASTWISVFIFVPLIMRPCVCVLVDRRLLLAGRALRMLLQ